jgi:hypothetical protein
MLDFQVLVEEADDVANALQALLSNCDKIYELRPLGSSLANVPVLLKYPKVLLPSLRKLVINEPNPDCGKPLLYALCFLGEYLDQRLKLKAKSLLSSSSAPTNLKENRSGILCRSTTLRFILRRR